MRILAMDTSFDPCGMALADEHGIVGSLLFRHGRDLSRWWAPRLQWLLAEAGWNVASLDGFAVCVGPGSFTGLRIGVTAMKTMAQATRRPIVGIDSLELLALPYRAAWPGAVASVLFCRTGEVYRAAYAEDGTPLLAPAVATVSRWAEDLAALSRPLLLCGDPGARNPIELPAEIRRADPWLALPHIDRLALEGRARLARGEGVDPQSLTVLYLKRTQVEEKIESERASSSSRSRRPGPEG